MCQQGERIKAALEYAGHGHWLSSARKVLVMELAASIYIFTLIWNYPNSSQNVGQ